MVRIVVAEAMCRRIVAKVVQLPGCPMIDQGPDGGGWVDFLFDDVKNQWISSCITGLVGELVQLFVVRTESRQLGWVGGGGVC